MEVKKSDIPQEAEFMTEFWKVAKKYYIPEEGDDYWKSAIDELTELSEKYPTEFCKCIILGFMKYLEGRFYKERKHERIQNP